MSAYPSHSLVTRSLHYTLRSQVLLRDISLTFLPGHFYAILGPNGAGKSTFLKTLCGIWAPTGGEVLWEGQAIHHFPRSEISKIITFVPQCPQVLFDFTVEEIVSMGRYAHGNHDAAPFVERALHTVDAWHLRTRNILELSGGERQRIYIARALVTESPIILLDEPTANLDIRHETEIWQLLLTLRRQEKIVIIANHDLNATRRYCDQVALIHQGSCLGMDTYEKIITEETLESVFGIGKCSRPSYLPRRARRDAKDTRRFF